MVMLRTSRHGGTEVLPSRPVARTALMQQA